MKGLELTEFERVEGDDEVALEGLASQVTEELKLAGLTVIREGDADVGVEIEIDKGADEAGGVYVTWSPSSRLSLAAVVAVQQGRFDAPAIQHSGMVKRIMCEALFELLKSARFGVEKTGDEMRPLAIRVTSPSVGLEQY
ncbi:hypothetical protein [Streptomyces sp. NRRL F-5193]|uniref:hypothetical protein n=1 Tax=Streptomyces sp. NRRL F-5193 TaxID=1463860 RepID=UPI00131CBBF5|nr:hypothetical protein [Streptomyces sp. NRRL F-5193]